MAKTLSTTFSHQTQNNQKGYDHMSIERALTITILVILVVWLATTVL